MSTYEQPLPLPQRRTSVAGVPRTKGISLAESMRIAFTTLLANKLRSILTALGVIIGVAAVVALLALGRGTQETITESITANGANLLTVRPGSLDTGGFSSTGSEAKGLTIDDAKALAEAANVPAAAHVSPEYSNFGTITAGSQRTSAPIMGATPVYLSIHNSSLAKGAFITDKQVTSSESVVVLGSRVATKLFAGQNAIDKTVNIQGMRFRVIGVLASKGRDTFGLADDSVVVPLTTAQLRLFGARDITSGKPLVSEIIVQARNQTSISAASAQITKLLRARRQIAAGAPNDFSIDNQQDLIDTIASSQRTITMYMGAIAAISLVVGGIGIMNIMLVSVRERTREIGLRKAIGARERDILTQFLIEALTLSTIGGLIGLLVGVLIAVIANQSGQARAIVSPASMALAVGFSMAIGLFFGIEPARRAAQLDPIDALRYD